MSSFTPKVSRNYQHFKRALLTEFSTEKNKKITMGVGKEAESTVLI